MQDEEDREVEKRTEKKLHIVLILGASWTITGICIIILLFMHFLGK